MVASHTGFETLYELRYVDIARCTNVPQFKDIQATFAGFVSTHVRLWFAESRRQFLLRVSGISPDLSQKGEERVLPVGGGFGRHLC